MMVTMLNAITQAWSPSSTYHQVPPKRGSTRSALGQVECPLGAFPLSLPWGDHPYVGLGYVIWGLRPPDRGQSPCMQSREVRYCYGLLNFANESFNQPQFNFLEILTFGMITLAALYCLRLWCERRLCKRMENLRIALSEVQVVDHPVHAHARAPVLPLAHPPKK